MAKRFYWLQLKGIFLTKLRCLEKAGSTYSIIYLKSAWVWKMKGYFMKVLDLIEKK